MCSSFIDVDMTTKDPSLILVCGFGGFGLPGIHGSGGEALDANIPKPQATTHEGSTAPPLSRPLRGCRPHVYSIDFKIQQNARVVK